MACVDKADMMKQAQNIWAMMDNMAVEDPQAYKKFIDKNLKEGKEYTEWKMVKPERHMCVQSKLVGSKSKTLYMNVCSWKRVPEPKSDEAPIPVMGSDIQHLNANISIVNVAFAPSVLEVYGRDCQRADEQTALINLAIDYIQDVHKVKIDRTFKILRQSSLCHGDWDTIVDSLRAKIDKNHDDSFVEDIMLKSMQEIAPIAQLSGETIVFEINKMKNGDIDSVGRKDIILPTTSAPSGGEKRKKVLIEEIIPVIENEKSLVEPGYTLRCVNADEQGNLRRLVLCVNLEGVKSVSECELDLTQDYVTLYVTARYRLDLRLPELVRDDLCRAKFSRKSSTLTVTLPTLN